MEVKVLGMGCARCKALCAEVETALHRLGLEASVTKVEKPDEIRRYAILMTPALVIDEKIKAAGRIPTAAELDRWLVEASAARTR